ncbi:VWA domain-containing protein [Hanstruepera marina]|uniref:VWA domain-containing protein n=1 Tax=Hanstruepera marina TaxID=2873265 RepID=UPI001CA6FB53|nr:VWA domain-containing protein [Hanstruepera marina]
MSNTVILYIVISGIIALLVALFQYRYKVKHKLSVNNYLLVLRFITVFAVILLLLNPKIEQLSTFYEKPSLVVAVDNSNSISFLNQDSLVENIVGKIRNHQELNEKFNIDFYAFGNELKLSDSLSFQDKQTNLDNLFDGLNDVYKQTVAPTIILSDGNQTYGSDYSFATRAYKQPIFPVILGDTVAHIDLKIEQLNVNKYAFLKNKFPVEAIVVYNGDEEFNPKFTVKSGSSTVYSSVLKLDKNSNSAVVNFTLPANKVGTFSYQVSVEPITSELNTQNNIKNFAIEVVDEKSKIAIVSDWLHPDIGALKKSIESNQQRTVSILTAKEYENQINDFQLVVLYQPNNRFKSIYEKLEASKSNKLVITGTKTDWNFLNQVNSFYTQKNSAQTENYLASPNQNYNVFIINELDFESFPPLKSKFGNVEFTIPFETVLFKKIRNTTTNNPLMASFEINGRREAIIFGEDIWKWRAQSFLNKNSFNPFDNFTGKLVQYLSTNKRKERLTLDYNSFYEGNSNVIIKAQYYNKNYEFDNRENLVVSVMNDSTKVVRDFPFVLRNNNFEVDLSSLLPSDYSFTVKTTTDNLSKSGKFKILEYNIEEQFLNADVTKMQALANNSYGKAYFPNTSQDLISSLLNDNRFVAIEKSTKNTVPLIDWKYLLALIAMCLASEWFIRKYNGLI